MATTPTRSGRTLDQFNDELRQTELWRGAIARALGTTPDALPTRFTLSDRQRKSLQREFERAGLTFTRGMEIDPAGNINNDNGLDAHLEKWGPIAAQVGLGIATGGMSLPASLAINAGAGAGIGALRDRSVKGALMGAGTGAASAAGGHFLRGLGGGQGAGGVLPSGRAISTDIAMRGVPGAIGSQGVSAGLGTAGLLAGRAIPGLAGAAPAVGGSQAASAGLGVGSAMSAVLRNVARNGGGGGADDAGQSLLDRILGGAQKYGPLALGAGSLIKGLTQGRPPAEDRMDAILKMAEDRARQQEPLFKALTAMAHSQLPTYAREGR